MSHAQGDSGYRAPDAGSMLRPRRPSAMVGRIEEARDPRSALARLVGYLRPYRGGFILVLAMVAGYTLLGLAGPWLMGTAIDRHIIPGRAEGLAEVALAMLASYVLSNLLRALADRRMATISQNSLMLLRRDLFARLQILPISFFDRTPAGELMSRLTNDIDAINQVVSQNVTALLTSVLSLVGILTAMFLLDVQLTLAALAVIPVMILFTTFVARYTRRGFRDLQMHLGSMNGMMEEAITGRMTAEAFGRKDDVLEEFDRQNDAVFRSGVSANSYALLMMPVSNALGNVFIVVMAAFGSWLALRGQVTVGVIAAFVTYGRNFVLPLRQLANMYNSIQAALAGSERIFEIIDTAPEPGADGLGWTGEVAGDVEFKEVDFSYVPGTQILSGVSFRAEQGRTVALVGPTGAGKTTMTNLLTRFYQVDSGVISMDGRDIREMNLSCLRGSLALVLQDTFLFADTVMENIRFGRLDATDEECIEAARMAQADHFIRQLPRGYETDLSEGASNLSQGQRQLLSISRAILADPEVLVLDEATSSVDTRTERRIQKALTRLRAGRTSIVIAHRLATIRDADLVLVLDGGRIVERGTHASLLAAKGFYHSLYQIGVRGKNVKNSA